VSFFRNSALPVVLLLTISPAIRADFSIQVNYLTSVTPSQQAAFESAAATWASLLSGYQNGIVAARSSGSSYSIGQTLNTLYIDARIEAIDGAGGVLGSAGPNQIIEDQLGYIISTDGSMRFDIADVANLELAGTLDDVILHEMAHVMGFGTLWELNGVYASGSGEFTGANATAAWQTDFGQLGTPDVELSGGSGTANGHWNENAGGAGLTGITDQFGRDMRDELMTGWLNGNSFISNMTLQSFVDIGYLVTAVPEPSTFVLVALAGFACLATRRRCRD
jgi:hypothetical protein